MTGGCEKARQDLDLRADTWPRGYHDPVYFAFFEGFTRPARGPPRRSEGRAEGGFATPSERGRGRPKLAERATSPDQMNKIVPGQLTQPQGEGRELARL